ncbi:TRAP transporter substrate-binding protein [Geosporobacter ferrireducens]|uniref:C4-dicarboxylate ABC transporter substrate-binding protein n=1 Tax=Geosporobacter ferrireducens TaxID=1424294 RepID=A0A1D8GEQ3_9FIRM|nr:TRAP transporter substrate-binding protein [Geosporobacter ferrireducens]AOT69394.1 hypothetical protein Gferi_07295 [Geosporobacter ferrireducens]
MKKVVGLVLVVAMFMVLLAGCSQNASSSGSSPSEQKSQQTGKKEPIVLKLAVESAVGTPGEVSGQDFKKMVEEKTNGEVMIDYYPVGQLGTGDDLTELLQTGSVDMSWRAIDWYSKFEPGWNILSMGFLFRDQEHLNMFLTSSKNEEFKANIVNKAGLRVLADNGVAAPRVVISKKPINTPEDMKGINMRVPEIEMYLKTWTGVGVNAVSVPWGEAYMVLQQGTVDALESPLGSIYGMKFHEAAKYITMTNHIYSPYVMVINEKSYNKLTEEQKTIIRESAFETGKLFSKYDSESADIKVQEMMNQGVTINKTPDIAAFQAKMESVVEKSEKDRLWPEGLYDYVQSLK